MSDHPKAIFHRRQVLASAAAAGTLSMLGTGEARGQGSAQVKLGLIGCGNRGKWIADLFARQGGYKLEGVCDYFEAAADEAGEKLGVGPGKRFAGLDGYKGLIESGVEAVAIISPPYFHPEQAAAAVEAGLHVYVAKPVAVDVPGCISIGESAKRASAKGRAFLVDFQTRATDFYIEAVKRIHDGALGRISFGEASYHANRLKIKEPNDGTAEGRLRNWVFNKALSGDIITEQNVHTLDVMSWVMDRPPLSAAGVCSRKVRTDIGDCNDSFSLLYRYSDNVGMTFSSRQHTGFGSEPSGIRNRVFGDEGTFEAKYGGQVLVRGDHFYRGGVTSAIYKDGAATNIETFRKLIETGNFANTTAKPSVRSTLVSILGRTAAYSGRQVTWAQLLKKNEKVEADLSGLRV